MTDPSPEPTTLVTIEIAGARVALPPGAYVASCRQDAPVEARVSRHDTGEIIAVVATADPPAWCRAFNQPWPDQPTWWRGRIVACDAAASLATPLPATP